VGLKMENKKSFISLFLIFLYGLILHSNTFFVSVIVFIIVLTLIISLPKHGFILFLITVIISPDLLVTKTYTGEVIISHSIFLDSLGGITFITILSISILIISAIRKPNLEINKFIFFTIFVPLIIPLYGILTTNNIPEFISSSSYFVVLIAMFFFLQSIKINRETLIDIFYYSIITSMILNIIITFYHGFTLVFWGSLCYAFPMVLLMKYKNRSYFTDILLISLIVMNLLIFPARGRIIVFIIILTIFLIVKLNVKNFLKTTVSIMIVSLIVVSLYKNIIPNEVISYLEWKIGTVDPTDMENESSSIRLIELQNIIMGSFDKIYPIFIGEGYGGYFVDKYVSFNISSILDSHAYKNEWIYERTFYRPHTVLNILLLKAGLLPTMIFFSSIFYLIGYYLRKIGKTEVNTRFIIVLPFLAFVMYTQKLQIVFAICMYILNESIIKYNKKKLDKRY
jgi:hypothetical protein